MGIKIPEENIQEFTLKLNDLSKGILLFLLIGHVSAILIYFNELANFYLEWVYPNIGGFNMKALDKYVLVQSVRYEASGIEKFITINEIRKPKSFQIERKLHKILQNNYDLYF